MIKFGLAYIGLAVFSWLLGLTAYRLVLLAWFREVPGSSDWTAVWLWSAIVFFPAALFSWPILLGLSDSIRKRRIGVLTLVGAASGLIPTIGFAVIWHGRAGLSAEAILIGVLFGTAGAVWGCGNALLSPWRAPPLQ